MKKKILLATDFSKNAWNAIIYAIELYKNIDCNFYILNTFTCQDYQFERLKAKSERELVKIMRLITFREENNSKHEFSTISIFNSLIEGVKAVVEEKDIDLVIMGTRGETNAKSILFGSNAIDIMEKSRNCPVLVVPEVADNVSLKEIVFPTNYKTQIRKNQLKHLIEIAKISNASVKILHVANSDELDDEQISNQQLLEEYFKDIDYSFHTLSYVEVSTAINCFVQSRESDMVTFINRRHSFFSSILNQPLVKNISHYTKVPVLVLHDLKN